MKILLSSLLFASLCTLSSWSVSSGTFVVTQSPAVSVKEGETVNITCCWTEKSNIRVTVNWLKNQSEIKSEIKLGQSSGAMKKEEKTCSSLNISNITTEDSGTYICKVNVEIPSLTVAKGNGTVITVKAKIKKDDQHVSRDSSVLGSPPTIVTISLAVVVPLLLITLICYCTMRRKQALAARIIYEVPHVDSETAEMDKHSTNSSTGSSQWCQVPLYEPFYFEQGDTEHGDTKESK